MEITMLYHSISKKRQTFMRRPALECEYKATRVAIQTRRNYAGVWRRFYWKCRNAPKLPS